MMMKQNNTFSLSRIWMLAKWDVGTNWKVYAWRYFGLYLGYLAIMTFAYVLSNRQGNAYEVDSVGLFSVCVCLILYLRQASLVMESMITKERRTLFLMLSASKLEKFVWRVFFASVFFILMGIVAFVLADLTRYLIFLSWGQGDTPFACCYYFIGWLWTAFTDFSVHDPGPAFLGWRYDAFGVPGYYFIYSLFILGGCAWRRLAGLKVLACLGLVAWGIPKMLELFAPENLSAIYFPYEWTRGAAAVLTILCWFHAYRFFSRSQVV